MPKSSKGDIYTVKSGDSLYKIANQFDTTIEAIKKLNNLTNNTLSIGQKLIIPSSSKDQTNQNDAANIYTVKSGDSLYKIALANNVSVQDILNANNLTSTTLSIGQKLIIPSTISNEKLYTVVSGDSLWSIAKKFNTTVNDIKNLNNLTSNTLSIGQKLKI